MGICKQAISQAVSKRDGECNLVYQDITSTASMNSATPLKASTESNAKCVTAAKAAPLMTAISGDAWSSAAREYVVNARTAAPLTTAVPVTAETGTGGNTDVYSCSTVAGGSALKHVASCGVSTQRGPSVAARARRVVSS